MGAACCVTLGIDYFVDRYNRIKNPGKTLKKHNNPLGKWIWKISVVRVKQQRNTKTTSDFMDNNSIKTNKEPQLGAECRKKTIIQQLDEGGRWGIPWRSESVRLCYREIPTVTRLK